MKIEGEGYSVEFDQSSGTVLLSGSLRLGGMPEYTPILALMDDAMAQAGGALSIDLRGLQLLNSSGITMMSKFVIGCRGKSAALKIIASENVPWQGKSLKNLQRLMPAIELVIQ